MKTAIVTGGSGDIGAAICTALAKIGYHVVITYRENRQSAVAVADKIAFDGGNCVMRSLDIRDYTEVEMLFSEITNTYGGIDLLVNNAGIDYIAPIDATSNDIAVDILNTNLLGSYYCCRAVTPHMVSKKSGCIVNVSSIWGEIGASCEVMYSASKAGIIGLTKALSKELAPSGIRVNCISPGFIDTKMNNNLTANEKEKFVADIPLMKSGNVQDIAEAVVFLSGEGSKYITGQVLSVNGGLT